MMVSKSKPTLFLLACTFLAFARVVAYAFQASSPWSDAAARTTRRRSMRTVVGRTVPHSSATRNSSSEGNNKQASNGAAAAAGGGGGGDNKAMQFLKKMGKVGGAANRDFRYAIGVDEGTSGKSAGSGEGMQKAKAAFGSCVQTGVVDDMSEDFPQTSSGTRWSGFTDKVMGGISMANLAREEFDGRIANVLRGRVSMANNGGFIQMATNLAPGSSELSSQPVDASRYEGVELDVQSFSDEDGSESFNVHLKTTACPKPYTSYRASFDAPNGKWETVRIPFLNFRGKGDGVEDTILDTSALTRVGIVAIGRPMKVKLAVGGFRFY